MHFDRYNADLITATVLLVRRPHIHGIITAEITVKRIYDIGHAFSHTQVGKQLTNLLRGILASYLP